MSTIPVIGLAGPAGCGKSTVGTLLAQHHAFVAIAFADPIRDALRAIFGISTQQFSDPIEKERVIPEIGKSPRQLMRSLGDWGRDQVSRDTWVQLTKTRAFREFQSTFYADGVVITDVRYENEARMIRENGGRIWHIHRPEVQFLRDHNSEIGIHPSLDLGDQMLFNDCCFDVLSERVAALLCQDCAR